MRGSGRATCAGPMKRAAARPTGMAALGAMRGVGASKLERYGTAVLAIVAAG